jgi:hypothetical protein
MLKLSKLIKKFKSCKTRLKIMFSIIKILVFCWNCSEFVPKQSLVAYTTFFKDHGT